MTGFGGLQYAFLICLISEAVVSPFLPLPNDLTEGFFDVIVGKPFLLKSYLEKKMASVGRPLYEVHKHNVHRH